MKINGVSIRVGNILDYNGKLWVVTKTQHTQPGKGGAYMQVEMKALIEGTKLHERFRSADTVERVHLDERPFQYLYPEGDDYVFMDQDTFDQIIASIIRFPEIGVPRIRNWYGKNITLRDVEVFVRQRQFTVRYHYKKSLNQIVLIHIWIDGQNHN